MKVFNMGDYDTVVAETKEKAVKVMHDMGADCEIDDVIEIEDIENTFCIYGMDHPDDIMGDDDDSRDITEEMKKHRISFKDLIEKYPDDFPMHFSSDI